MDKKVKLSLDSDADAPDNEFEQISGEDYADEYDDKDEERY